MDVIDLCDDDGDLDESNGSSNKSTVSTRNPSSNSNTVDVKETSTTNKKPILKVVAIEKLKMSIGIDRNVTNAKRTSRRKSVLLPKVHDNDSIEFLDESSNISGTQVILTGPKMDGINNTAKTIDASKLLLNLDDVPNPNIELMRRVAFLRVSIQHTLKELGLSSVKFENTTSWGGLRAQYMQNKKNKEKNSVDSN